MAEELRSLADQIQAGMERQYIAALSQIHAWHQDWDAHLAHAERRFAHAGMEWREMDSWDRGPVMDWGLKEESRQALEEQRHALIDIRDDLDWRITEQTPEYQAHLREQERIDRAIEMVTDPDYLGQQAEERFYAEQDPGSAWYREDLYHGAPGPEVAAEGERRELFIVGDDGQLERPEWMDVLQEFGSQAKLLHDQHNGLEAETSDPDMGASWQQTLEHLQARLEALERDFPAQHRAQGHDRDEGMGYSVP